MSKFIKQFIFISLGLAIVMAGGLAIYSATPGGKIIIQTGRHSDWQAPVAWWKMDEASWNGTAGEVKDSIGTNNGTSTNGANTTSTAVFGRAGSFVAASSQYIDVVGPTSLTTSTISFWMKNGGSNAGGKGIVDATIFVIEYDSTTGKLNFIKPGVSQNQTNRTILDTNWHYVVAVAISGNVKFYVDGVADTASLTPTFAAGSIIRLGGRVTGTTNYFNGLIDDVRIYNYALTADQVRQIYNETAKLKINPILGHDLDLDAKYYAQAANNTVHDITTQDISVSAWVKVDADINTYEAMVSKRGASGAFYHFAISNTNWGAYIYIADSGGKEYSIYGTKSLNDNKWHFVSGIIDRDNATNCKIFVDGVNNTASRVGTVGDVSSIANASNFNIGANNNGTRKFDGQIRDVKLYYAAGDHWTDAQILYQAQHPFDYSANAGTLTDYWRCDEGTGTTVSGKVNNLTLSSALAWSTQPKVKVSTGLVGYWKLDDNNALTSVIDYSGKRNTGTAYSGTATSTSVLSTSTAMVGRAMSFDGVDDYVGLGDNNKLLITGDITISMWIYPLVSFTNKYIWNTGRDTFEGYHVFTASDGGVYYRTSQNNTGGSYETTYTAAFVISLGTWRHVVVTRKGSRADIYINGVNRTSSRGTHLDPTFINYKNSRIGIYNDGSYAFNGLIDDVRIYNYARTGEQILQDYQRGLNGLP